MGGISGCVNLERGIRRQPVRPGEGRVGGLRAVDRLAVHVQRVEVAGAVPVAYGVQAVEQAVVVADDHDQSVRVLGGGCAGSRRDQDVDTRDDRRGINRAGVAGQCGGDLVAPHDAAGEAVHAVNGALAVACGQAHRVGHDVSICGRLPSTTGDVEQVDLDVLAGRQCRQRPRGQRDDAVRAERLLADRDRTADNGIRGDIRDGVSGLRQPDLVQSAIGVRRRSGQVDVDEVAGGGGGRRHGQRPRSDGRGPRRISPRRRTIAPVLAGSRARVIERDHWGGGAKAALAVVQRDRAGEDGFAAAEVDELADRMQRVHRMRRHCVVWVGSDRSPALVDGIIGTISVRGRVGGGGRPDGLRGRGRAGCCHLDTPILCAREVERERLPVDGGRRGLDVAGGDLECHRVGDQIIVGSRTLGTQRVVEAPVGVPLERDRHGAIRDDLEGSAEELVGVGLRLADDGGAAESDDAARVPHHDGVAYVRAARLSDVVGIGDVDVDGVAPRRRLQDLPDRCAVRFGRQAQVFAVRRGPGGGAGDGRAGERAHSRTI